MKAPKIAYNGPAPVAAAAAEVDAAIERTAEAAAAHHKAVRDLEAARQKQAAAVQAASATGAGLPPTTSISKGEQALKDAKTRVDECQRITVGRGRTLTREVAANADAWRASLAVDRVAAFDRLDQAALELDAAIDNVAEHLAVGAWVARCERRVAEGVNTLTMPPVPPRESVLSGTDPGQAVEKFMGWLAGIVVQLEPVEQAVEPEEVVDTEAVPAA